MTTQLFQFILIWHFGGVLSNIFICIKMIPNFVWISLLVILASRSVRLWVETLNSIQMESKTFESDKQKYDDAKSEEIRSNKIFSQMFS